MQRLKQEQKLVLNQVDKAIALFDQSHHLVVFNHKLTQIWQLSTTWLAQQPHFDEFFAAIAASGYWSIAQCEQLKAALQQDAESFSLHVEQTNGICLEVHNAVTFNGGHLLTFYDVTARKQVLGEASLAQANLNAEVRRLTFLLGLLERLQPASELLEIGEFALSYLVQAMNAAFGDVKVITGEGIDAHAGLITNQISSEFIAVYGAPAVAEMQALLNQGIPYGQGLLWQVVETGKPLFVEDYHNHPQAVPEFRHPAIGQLGIFPIPAANGNIIGVLTLESRTQQKLKDAPQQDMLLAACRLLGVAIERAQAQEHLRQINEDLGRASHLKSQFLASMSHELRTPLNSILGFSDLLLRQVAGSLNERQFNYVQTMERSGQHLLQLINDILDLSKIEAGKAELNLETISIHTLCSECLKMVQPRADKKRLALSLELDYRLQQASLDERRVRQILINLLSNAIKFTPERGKIKLSGCLAYGSQLAGEFRPDRSPINPSTPYLCFSVTDTGIGIPQDKWHLLFRPFQQIDASLTRQHEGTGLGLALTKRLAELHGGTVSLESVQNQGSTFRAWLPLNELREELSQKASGNNQQEASGNPLPFSGRTQSGVETKRILIVEDQPYNQVLVSEVLELQGYAVELICDGSTMLNTIQSPLVTPQSLPDLILMDIQLPEVDGFELIRQLKANQLWKSVPILAVTAMAMPGDRERCLAVGAEAYLSKPLDLDKVIKTVHSLLAPGIKQ